MGFDAKATCSRTIRGLAQIPTAGRIPGDLGPTRGLFDSFYRGGRDTGRVLAMPAAVRYGKSLFFVTLVALSGTPRGASTPLLRFRLSRVADASRGVNM